MAVFAVGPLLGPVIRPVMGGFIAENAGWRWSFWVLTIVVSSLVPLVADAYAN